MFISTGKKINKLLEHLFTRNSKASVFVANPSKNYNENSFKTFLIFIFSDQIELCLLFTNLI